MTKEIIMVTFKIKPLIILAATLFLSQNVLASTGLDSIGTGSAGSYSHGKSKGEGSKTKKIPHIAGSKKHYKKEGSGKKSYSHSGKSKSHGYSHKKSEGSASKHHANSGNSYEKNSGHGHGGHISKSPFTHLLRFKVRLGLTKAQVTEMKQLRFEYDKQSVRNKAEHKIAHMEFDKQVHAEKLDENTILLAAETIARTKTDKIMAMAKAKIALLKLLTEEQRKKAHTMHSAYSAH
jgi:Spy/CpxP family protein refolding chaperone